MTRLLLVMPPDSGQGWDLARALAEAGVEVHAAAAAKGRFPRPEDGITVHTFDAGNAHEAKGTAGLIRGAAGSVDRLAFRLSARSAVTLRRATRGRLDPDLPGRWRATAAPHVDPALLATLGDAASHDPGASIAALRDDAAGQARIVAFLAEVIEAVRPDLVHAGPMRRCGVVAWAAVGVADGRARGDAPRPRLVLGARDGDLGFWPRMPDQAPVVRGLLAATDGLLVACAADVPRARELGYRGPDPLVLPAGPGFDVAIDHAGATGPPSTRPSIVLHGGQDLVGRGLVALEAVRRCADLLADREVVVHQAHDDLADAAERTGIGLGLRMTVHRRGTRAHADLLRDLGAARVSIALSLAGGVGSWTPEAMTMGAFPIRSLDAGPSGLLTDGRTALLVHPEEPADAAAALRRALTDDALVDAAVERSLAIARAHFERAVVVPDIVDTLGAIVRAGAGARAATP